MSNASNSAPDDRRWRVDTGVAVLGVLLAAVTGLAGVAGSVLGARVAAETSREQIADEREARTFQLEQSRDVALRAQRSTSIQSFLTNLNHKLVPTVVDDPDSLEYRTRQRDERLAYRSSVQKAVVYASPAETELIRALDRTAKHAGTQDRRKRHVIMVKTSRLSFMLLQLVSEDAQFKRTQ